MKFSTKARTTLKGFSLRSMALSQETRMYEVSPTIQVALLGFLLLRTIIVCRFYCFCTALLARRKMTREIAVVFISCLMNCDWVDWAKGCGFSQIYWYLVLSAGRNEPAGVP